MRTEELFFAILVSAAVGDEYIPWDEHIQSPQRAGTHIRRLEGMSTSQWEIADGAAQMLERGTSPDAVARIILAGLPDSRHAPFSILRVDLGEYTGGGSRAWLVECDAPPLFMTRRGQLVLLPVLEEEITPRHLLRTCQFVVQAGDHLAMVSEGYIHARGWSRRWAWRDIANSIRRWTDTGCDAAGLLGALVRMYYRLAEEPGQIANRSSQFTTVVAMHVRPVRTATIWTGPPATRAQDVKALERLMAEPGMRIICGDTTAQIAARLLEAELGLEPRPGQREPPAGLPRVQRRGQEHPWAKVPPISYLQGVGLVTEGLVTLSKAREPLAEAKRTGSLPRGEDGATRLARALLFADRIHWIVGLAVNPAQAADTAHTVPLRQVVVDELVRDLKAHGKLVSVEYV